MVGQFSMQTIAYNPTRNSYYHLYLNMVVKYYNMKMTPEEM